MSEPVSLFRFIDGPLMAQEQRRADVVRRMAKDLIEADAFRDERDAIRVLMHRGYPSYDVMALVGEAQAEAERQLIAVEISRS
jgi:hypothetical protein